MDPTHSLSLPPHPGSNVNLAGLLWHAAASRGEHVALVERERATTYAALRDRASAIAGALLERGIGPGDRVAIMLDRGANAAAAYFGAIAAGAIAININETLRPLQIEHVLEHAGARLFLTTRELIDRLPRALATDTEVCDVDSLPHASRAEPVRRIGDDPAQISYTSGSSGPPKGVVLSHANLLAVAGMVVGYLQLRSDDRIASLLPFSFVYGLNQLLCAVGAGATLVVERSPLPQQIITTLRAQNVTVLAAVPPLWAQFLSHTSFRDKILPSLRILTNAGGGIAPALVRRIRAAQPHAELVLMYGLTETLRSTYLPSAEVDAHPDAIGRAVPGAEILVIDDEGRACAPGEVGELVHRGPTVALGYWNDPLSTAAVFRPNPLRVAGTPDRERVVFSGDLVRADEAGILYFVGRRDHMIKTLGYRVSPDEICAVLHASQLVTEAVVASEPCAARGERIVACIVLSPGATVDQVEHHCKLELPRYMQPARYAVRSKLPRLPSGKLDLSTVRDELRGELPTPDR